MSGAHANNNNDKILVETRPLERHGGTHCKEMPGTSLRDQEIRGLDSDSASYSDSRLEHFLRASQRSERKRSADTVHSVSRFVTLTRDGHLGNPDITDAI